MVYISADGTIGKKPLTLVQKFSRLKLQHKAVAFAILALGANRWLNPNPLANGNIPAALLNPDKHWNRIMRDDGFVRSMTQYLGSKTKRKGEAVVMERCLERDELHVQKYDFGGPDGHVIEKADFHSIEGMRGTRCSTTQSALTAYFCGAEVAENQDVGLDEKLQKPFYMGVTSFSAFISCRHEQGERAGTHRRSVYRIGVGTEDPVAGMSHAFSLVAQPDGSFYWLQSFISHYSLQNWMEKVDAIGRPLAHLSLSELEEKLNQVKRLMHITEWSFEANNDYHELFGVDKEKEASSKGKQPVYSTWKPTHRLDSFVWDEACEYPTKKEAQQSNAQDEDDKSIHKDSNDMHRFDQCLIPLYKNMLEEQLKGPWAQEVVQEKTKADNDDFGLDAAPLAD